MLRAAHPDSALERCSARRSSASFSTGSTGGTHALRFQHVAGWSRLTSFTGYSGNAAATVASTRWRTVAVEAAFVAVFGAD